jgi:hypothetical protein
VEGRDHWKGRKWGRGRRAAARIRGAAGACAPLRFRAASDGGWRWRHRCDGASRPAATIPTPDPQGPPRYRDVESNTNR